MRDRFMLKLARVVFPLSAIMYAIRMFACIMVPGGFDLLRAVGAVVFGASMILMSYITKLVMIWR
jgi:hypothetical protein